MLKGIRTILIGESTITNVVGSGSNAKIFYGIVPQGTSMPYIVLDADPGTPNETKNGSSELDQMPVEITCSCEVYHTESSITGAYDLAKLVETALDFYDGTAAGFKMFIKKSIPINTIPINIPNNERYDASITFEVYEQ